MRERVLAVHATQLACGPINATLPAGKLREICPLDAAAGRALGMAIQRFAF